MLRIYILKVEIAASPFRVSETFYFTSDEDRRRVAALAADPESGFRVTHSSVTETDSLDSAILAIAEARKNAASAPHHNS